MPSRKRRCNKIGKRKDNIIQNHNIWPAPECMHPLEKEEVIAHVLQFFPVNNLRVFRRINKTWSQETLLLFRRRRSPLVTLTLDQDNLVVGSAYLTTINDKEPLLLNLQKMVGVEDDKPVPTFRLIITPGMFQSGTRQGFEKLIRDHGSSLVELKLTAAPEQAKNWFPLEIHLPLLKKLYLCFTQPVASIKDFLEPLLKACANLDELSVPAAMIPCGPEGRYSWVPPDLANLLLPETLSVLDLSCEGLKSTQIGVLVKTPLKKLKVLRFRLLNEKYEPDIISRILNNVRETLVEVNILGVQHGGRAIVPHYVSFPVMESLTILSTAPQLELAGNDQNLSMALPKLDELNLQHINLAALRKWIGISKLETVKSLLLVPVNLHLPETHPNYLCSVPGDMISQINANFPNLQILMLNQDQNDWIGLKSVIVELRRLKELQLLISYSGSHDMLTATLLGIPVQQAIVMREGFKELTLHNKDLTSIANMHNLTTLRILKHPQSVGHQSELDPVIPDHVFHQALFKMPRLSLVVVGKGLSVSEEIRKRIAELKQKGGRLRLQFET